MNTLDKRIDEIPNMGYWKAETRETFREVGKLLHDRGLSEDEVVEMLTRLYFAASEEYGE